MNETNQCQAPDTLNDVAQSFELAVTQIPQTEASNADIRGLCFATALLGGLRGFNRNLNLQINA